MRKYTLRQLIVVIVAFVAMLIGLIITNSFIKNTVSDQWATTLEYVVNDFDKEMADVPDDSKATEETVNALGDYLSNFYFGDTKIDFAIYDRSFSVSSDAANRFVYSSTDMCAISTRYSDFFRQNNASKCSSKIQSSSSNGYYNTVKINGHKYCIIFTRAEHLKLGVIGFVPYEELSVYLKIINISFSIFCLIIIAGMAAMFYVAHTQVNKIQSDYDELRETMEAKDNRADVLSYLMNDFTFEYDVKSDVVVLGDKYQTLFHRGRTFIRFKETLQTHYTIYHLDIEKFTQAFENITNGNDEGSFLFRLQMINGTYEWFNAMYKVIFNDAKEPSFVVGKIMNVHESQKEKEILLTKSTKDPLTGLLNRGEMEKRTGAYLESMEQEDEAAMLIMDLDHFKSVNDTFGHSKGDDLLKEVAGLLKNEFRTTDIVGRLGGDEFFVFMKDISCLNDAVNKCSQVLKKLERKVTFGNISVDISSSMGIVQVNPGEKFSDLYMKADAALYHAKENGRDQICIYSDDILKDGKEE